MTLPLAWSWSHHDVRELFRSFWKGDVEHILNLDFQLSPEQQIFGELDELNEDQLWQIVSMTIPLAERFHVESPNLLATAVWDFPIIHLQPALLFIDSEIDEGLQSKPKIPPTMNRRYRPLNL